MMKTIALLIFIVAGLVLITDNIGNDAITGMAVHSNGNYDAVSNDSFNRTDNDTAKITPPETEIPADNTKDDDSEAEPDPADIIDIDHAPEIYLNYPAGDSILRFSDIIFNWTATDDLDDEVLCNLIVDGSVGKSNIISLNGSPTSYTVSGLSSGYHNWSVTCRDSADKRNTASSNRFLVVRYSSSGGSGGAPKTTESNTETIDVAIVMGHIYNASANPINGATVYVKCLNNSNIEGPILSVSEGYYEALLICPMNGVVEINATKENIGSATNTGTVRFIGTGGGEINIGATHLDVVIV